MKILIIRNDHLGDLIISLPLIESLKRDNPELSINLLVAEEFLVIPQWLSSIDKIFFQYKNENIKDLAERLSNFDFKMVLSFPSTRENAILVKKLRIPVKIGYAGKIYNWFSFNRLVFIRRSHPPVHEQEFMAAFCKRAGFKINIPFDFKLKIPQKILTEKEDFIKNFTDKEFITIHPGGRGSSDNFSLKTWAFVAKMLSEKIEENVFFVLGPFESLTDDIKNILLNSNVKIIKDISITELAILLNKAKFIVSGNTGPMHLGAILGRRTLSFFSSRKTESKEKWRPLSKNALIFCAKKGKTLEESFNVSQITEIIQSNLKDKEMLL